MIATLLITGLSLNQPKFLIGPAEFFIFIFSINIKSSSELIEIQINPLYLSMFITLAILNMNAREKTFFVLGQERVRKMLP